MVEMVDTRLTKKGKEDHGSSLSKLPPTSFHPALPPSTYEMKMKVNVFDEMLKSKFSFS
jgi:hypothetical protein